MKVSNYYDAAAFVQYIKKAALVQFDQDGLGYSYSLSRSLTYSK